MEPLQIFDALSERGRLPVEAIHAARECRAVMVPLFLEKIERFTSSQGQASQAEADSLFMAFHLLGEWREKTAYRPLAKFLQLSDRRLEPVLGDGKTETSHRVMAAVFDGDPEPLREIVRDAGADEYVRKRMFDALTMLTICGDLPRIDMIKFLETCFSELQPQQDCYAWQGWIESISMMGLPEMTPLVQQAFARGSADPSVMSFENFEEDLQYVVRHPGAYPAHVDGGLSLFGDTIEEMRGWACFQSKKERADRDSAWRSSLFLEPERNPLRHVGRNDPCPCGSGKKFKKCCLNADRDGEAGSAAGFS